MHVFNLIDNEPTGIVKVMEHALRILTRHSELEHVSVDVDVLDPLFAPRTGIISRGGLSYWKIFYIINSPGEAHVVNSIDLIEIDPPGRHPE